MRQYWIATTLLPILCFAGPGQRNYWNGDQHPEYAEEYVNSANELLHYIPIESHHRLLDIGCGDGSIAYALATMVPLGSIVGIDISPIMIDSAKKTYFKENLSFETLNALDIDAEAIYDTVVSFSALQSIQDQKHLLTIVKKALKPAGHFFFQMPCEIPPAMNIAIQETMTKQEWAPYYVGFDPKLTYFSAEDYELYIHETGLEEQSIKTRIHTHIFSSKSAFISFLLQWFPYLDPLPRGKKMHFMNEVIHKYVEAMPIDQNGTIFFPVKLLTVSGVKPI